tara:strand:- start:766 stop:1077 length:312 start_codon:yes stop_codon:yes gene_type:complete
MPILDVDIPFSVFVMIDDTDDFPTVLEGKIHAKIEKTYEKIPAPHDNPGYLVDTYYEVADVCIDEDSFMFLGGLASSANKNITEMAHKYVEEHIDNYTEDFEE